MRIAVFSEKSEISEISEILEIMWQVLDTKAHPACETCFAKRAPNVRQTRFSTTEYYLEESSGKSVRSWMAEGELKDPDVRTA